MRKLNLTVMSVLLLACFPVNAQDVSQAELAQCAAKPTAAEKLNCYEALTAIPEPPPDQPATESPEPAAADTIEAATPAPPANELPDEAAAMSVAAGVTAEIPAASTKPSAEPASPPPAARDSRPSAPDDLGKEQLDVKVEKDDPFPITATVNEVTQSGSGRLYFHFSNGQVWRQIEPRRFHYPKDQNFEVTVSQGMMREYRLRVGEKGPMTRIRRVE